MNQKEMLSQIEFTGHKFELLNLTTVHPSGNKYFKLKHNLAAAQTQGFNKIVSFGGAWSNHIHALSKIGLDTGLNTIGIIRGEAPDQLSPTLLDAKQNGMHLHFVSRTEYRNRDNPIYLKSLQEKFGSHYLLPEGGTNTAGLQGTAEIVDLLDTHCADYDEVIVPVGSGGTIAGIAANLKTGKHVTGICVLKGAGGIDQEIGKLIPNHNNWSIDHHGHCGGYAKCPPELKQFILDFEAQTKLKIEPVYTGKMFYRLCQLIKSDPDFQNKRVIAIHTGGLQGRRGFDF